MRKALLVGINRYPAPNELAGCVNDVMQMRDLLIAKFGFAPADIQLLVDGEATLANMEARLAWLAEGPGDGAGDVRVFHYSGHGSQVEDESGDEPDGADECLCPVDCDDKGFLIDDRLRTLYKRVPKQSALVLVMDCCHAGTNNKDRTGQITYRFLPPSNATKAAIERAQEKYLAQRKDFVKRALREVLVKGDLSEEELERVYSTLQAKFDASRSRYGDVNNRENNLLLAGCRDRQTSADARIAGDYHGAFTYFLHEAIAQGGPLATYREVVKRTAESLKKERFTQTPQLEGRGARKDRPLFSPFN